MVRLINHLIHKKITLKNSTYLHQFINSNSKKLKIISLQTLKIIYLYMRSIILHKNIDNQNNSNLVYPLMHYFIKFHISVNQNNLAKLNQVYKEWHLRIRISLI